MEIKSVLRFSNLDQFKNKSKNINEFRSIVKQTNIIYDTVKRDYVCIKIIIHP